MIRCHFFGAPGQLRVFIEARLYLPDAGITGKVDFTINPGSDVTILAPTDAKDLGLKVEELEEMGVTVGIGGATRTVVADERITIGLHVFPVALRILAPLDPEEQEEIKDMPSLLGTDVLAYFALFMEERTERAFLLDPDEADALPLPR